MIKISDNVLIRSIDQSKVVVIQSTGDYDYREVLDLKNNGRLEVCLPTDKFFSVEGEGLLELSVEGNLVLLKTSEGEYKLPILKERGILLSKPEVLIPEGDPARSWEYDFSGKSIETKSSANSVNQASLKVIVGENLLARVMNNVMEVYGDTSSQAVCIGLKEYSLISKMGKVKLNLYTNCVLQVCNENSEVRISNTAAKFDIGAIMTNVKSDDIIASVDLSQLKFKTMSKFLYEKVYVTFTTGKVSFTTESVRKVVEDPNLIIAEPITLEVNAKDIKNLVGKVSLALAKIGNGKAYSIKTEDKGKTVYLLVMKYEGDLKW